MPPHSVPDFQAKGSTDPLPPGANSRDRWLDLADESRDKTREALANGDRRMAELWDEHERTLLRNAYEDVPHPAAAAPTTDGRAPTGTLADLIGRIPFDPGFSREFPPGWGPGAAPAFQLAQAETTGDIPPLPKPKPSEITAPQSNPPVDERIPGGKQDPWPESTWGVRFRNELHARESQENNRGYEEDQPQSGRYQMTVGALKEAGMIDKETGKWKGKYGIWSKADFLRDRTAQEKAFSDYFDKLSVQLEAEIDEPEEKSPMGRIGQKS